MIDKALLKVMYEVLGEEITEFVLRRYEQVKEAVTENEDDIHAPSS
jgi:hypothetical protein